jgi:hypothetical protein
MTWTLRAEGSGSAWTLAGLDCMLGAVVEMTMISTPAGLRARRRKCDGALRLRAHLRYCRYRQ